VGVLILKKLKLLESIAHQKKNTKADGKLKGVEEEKPGSVGGRASFVCGRHLLVRNKHKKESKRKGENKLLKGKKTGTGKDQMGQISPEKITLRGEEKMNRGKAGANKMSLQKHMCEKKGKDTLESRGEEES